MPDALAEGRAALAALDRTLAAKPARDLAAFTDATERLCAMRATLIAADDRVVLPQVNGLISAVLAGQHPIGPLPWSQVSSARDTQRGFLATLAG